MPSKEEYLDNLLKGLINEHEELFDDVDIEDRTADEVEEAVDAEDAVSDAPAPFNDEMTDNDDIALQASDSGTPGDEALYDAALDDEASEDLGFDIGNIDSVLNNADEDDIERILRENREEYSDTAADEKEHNAEALAGEISDDIDLSDIYTDDDEINDIHNMLQKADNNEAIDEDILKMLNSIPDEAYDGQDNAENEAESQHTGADRAEERRLKRQEKKEARRLAKEARQAKRREKRKEKKPVSEIAETDDINEDFKYVNGSDINTDISAEMDAFLDGALSDDIQQAKGFEMEDLGADSLKDSAAEPEPAEDFISTVDDSVADAFVGQEISIEDAIDDIREKSGSKKSFFAKLLDLFTEEDEAEDEDNGDEIRLSEENQSIINELDNEADDGRKGKKKKKGSKADKKNSAKDRKNKKKSKNGDADENSRDGDAEGALPENEGKGKKEKKKHKLFSGEKDKEPEASRSSKRLSRKRVILIAIICLSIMAVIILSTGLISDYSVKKEGRQAFSEGDYQTCYQNLYGKELSESEQVMFSQSECILRIRLWLREYELFAGEGSEAEALDSLIQSVCDYTELYEYAAQWDCIDEVAAIYEQMLDILSNKYGLTEEEAKEIADEPDDVEYTKKVTAVAEGGTYGLSEASQGGEEAPQESMSDMLPEEESFIGADFVDNMSN